MATDLFSAQLIFTGGTALAKAHRLLQRFSEDIDFRLVLPQEPSLSRSGQRKLLSKIRSQVQRLSRAFPTGRRPMEDKGREPFFFIRRGLSDRGRPIIRPPTSPADRIYCVHAIAPDSPGILLHAELTKTGPEIEAVACIDPVENAADKISALIWRVPDRARQPADDDPDLTRHVHDLAVLQPYAVAHGEFRRLAIGVISQHDGLCSKIKGKSLEEKTRIRLDILNTISLFHRRSLTPTTVFIKRLRRLLMKLSSD